MKVTEKQVEEMIRERQPTPKAECESCGYVFDPRSCCNCSIQGGTGEELAMPFSGWEAV